MLSFNGLRAGFRLPPLGTDLPLAEGKVDSDAPEGLVETLVPRAEEWIHVLICAKEQQAHRTVIPRGTPTHRAPLAEIDYWDTQLATLQSLSGQVRVHLCAPWLVRPTRDAIARVRRLQTPPLLECATFCATRVTKWATTWLGKCETACA